jgi:phage-related protein
MSILDSVLGLVRSVVNGISDQINKLVSSVMDTVTSPLKGLVNQVVGGIWKGNGADRFVQEMNSEVIPSLTNLGSLGIDLGSTIGQAVAAIDGADKQATSLVGQLVETFQGIVSGLS